MTQSLSIINLQEVLLIASSNILTMVFGFLPTLIAAFFVFLIGLILAKWGKALTIKTLKVLKLSAIVKRSGLELFLEKAEVTVKIEEFFGGVIRWLIILIFFIATVNILGLTTFSSILNTFLAYVPKIISAILVLTIGVLLAGLIEKIVKGALAQVDLKASRLLAKIASYLVLIFTTLTAINELGIAQALINALFTGTIAMLALGFGLAIGLGSKDLVAKVLNEWYENLKKEVKKQK